MLDVKVVIGANYGDEGKGLVTSYLTRAAVAKNNNVIVVLNNGGPQRGHTVVKDDIRHVFHHLGSGTLLGADTYITENFIVNPMVFIEEYHEIQKLNIKQDFKVYVHPDCKVTTPFDMMVNQIASICLDTHDSCGYGIWETIKRYESESVLADHNLLWFFINIIRNKHDKIREYLKEIYNNLTYRVIHTIKRKLNEKTTIDPSEYEKAKTLAEIQTANYIKDIDIDGLINHWIDDLEEFFAIVYIQDITEIRPILTQYSLMIIENGQGILLDKDYDKKFGTPSITGARGAAKFLSNPDKELSKIIDSLEFIYVSRPYITRHGDGYLTGDPILMPESDQTNVPNNWQGIMSYSTLDYERLLGRTFFDFQRGESIINNTNFEERLDDGRPLYSLYFTHGELKTNGLNIEEIRSKFKKLKESDGEQISTYVHNCRVINFEDTGLCYWISAYSNFSKFMSGLGKPKAFGINIVDNPYSI